jgi:hypothetical protein
MRKNTTLPVIKRQLIVSTTSSKDGLQKLEDKLLTHDEEIIRNDQIISNLAN